MAISSVRHLVRQANLKLLITEFDGASALATLVGTPKSHISALVAGRRGMGDDLATKFEKKCEKPPGWMDDTHSEGAAAVQERKPQSLTVSDPDEQDLILAFRNFPAAIKQEMVRDFMRLAIDYQSADAVAVFEKHRLRRPVSADTVAHIPPKPSEPPRPNDWDGPERRQHTVKVDTERRESLINRPSRPSDAGAVK
jgi:hypothetical protein